MNQNNPAGENRPLSFAVPENRGNKVQYAQKAPEQPESAVNAAFALVFFLLGRLYWQLQFWAPAAQASGAGTAVFTVLFCASVYGYLRISGRRPAKNSGFWLCTVLLLGVSAALPYGGLPFGLPHTALHAAAVYWVLAASGTLARQKTSGFIALDLANGFFRLPFGNFFRIFSAPVRYLMQKRRELPEKKTKTRLPAVLAGLAAGGVCLAAVLPMLARADAGFAALMRTAFSGFGQWLTGFDGEALAEALIKMLFAVPTAQFLYGLVYGCVRETPERTREIANAAEESCRRLRRVPVLTVCIAEFSVCGAYLVFIALQARYLFGAFFGMLPAGFSFAEYARKGFFELCRVAVLNLCILIAAGACCRVRCREHAALRACNTAVCVLTLVLLAAAAAKTGLYIAAFGLTVRRVTASFFMIWLAAVFVCILVQQKQKLQTVRIAAVLGSILVTILCLAPIELICVSVTAAVY